MSTIYTYFLRKCKKPVENRTIESHINFQLKIRKSEIGVYVIELYVNKRVFQI